MTVLTAAVFGARPATGARETRRINPCQIGGQNFDSAAFEHLAVVLSDTGEDSATFAYLRVELGLVGTKMDQVTVVRDTTLCRRALTAWKVRYQGLDNEQAALAKQVNGGLLFRLTPNRLALAVAVFDSWTMATFFVTDSNFKMVRNGLM